MTALLKMTNDIQDRLEALKVRADEKGAVSIEYLAIALVAVVVVGIAISAAKAAEGTIDGEFQRVIKGIFNAK